VTPRRSPDTLPSPSWKELDIGLHDLPEARAPHGDPMVDDFAIVMGRR
jgi:hypothetical protein